MSEKSLKDRFDRIAPQLQVRSLDDWYRISDKKLRDADPTISHYIYARDSHGIAAALQAAYPEHTWKAWRFTRTPKGFWDNRTNHLLTLADCADQLGVRSPADWYAISPKQLVDVGGKALLNQYNGSMVSMLQALLPSHPWALWKFKYQTKLPNKYWSSLDVQRRFFEQIAADLHPDASLDVFYEVEFSKLETSGLASILNNIYHGNRILALTTIFPEHKWLPWMFKVVDSAIWTNQSIVRDYFSWLLEKLGPDAKLSTLTPDLVVANCGRGLLNRAEKTTKSESPEQSLRFALQRAFPEKAPVELPAAPSVSVDKQVSALEEQLDVKAHGLNQWYKVTSDQIALMTPWRNPVEMWDYLVATYTQHEWMPWLFANVTIRLGAKWRDPTLQRRFFDWAFRELKLASMDDWYSAGTVAQISKLGGRPILSLHSDSVAAALTRVYPDHIWDNQRFKQSKVASRSATTK